MTTAEVERRVASRWVEVPAGSSPGGAIAAAVPGVWRGVPASQARCEVVRGSVSAAGASGGVSSVGDLVLVAGRFLGRDLAAAAAGTLPRRDSEHARASA